MKRRFRIATAKQVRSTDMKRAAAHQAQAAAIQRRQKRYNNEVAMTQCEVREVAAFVVVVVVVVVVDCDSQPSAGKISLYLSISMEHIYIY
jgi:hypothetical protein